MSSLVWTLPAQPNQTARWEAPTAAALPPGGTTGEVLTKASDADGDADWEPAGGSQPVFTPASVLPLGGVPGVSLSTLNSNDYALAGDLFFAVFFPWPVTVTKLWWGAATPGSGDPIRLGLYEAGEDWQPGALLWDSGEQVLEDTTPVSEVVSVALHGRYLVAETHENESDGLILARAEGSFCQIGFDPALLTTAQPLDRFVMNDRAYAAFPDPGAAWTDRDPDPISGPGDIDQYGSPLFAEFA